MTQLPALIDLLGATAKKSTGSPLFFLVFIGIAVVGYFAFLKPQQRKAHAARAAAHTDIEVGDEVQTIGGVIGTVLEIHGERYTLLTGALGSDGNLSGAQPTRIVFLRQAIAKKIDRLADPSDVDVEDEDADADEGTTASAEHDPVEAEHPGEEEAEGA
ncbi:MAG TPA: preprotein translocase subunit YajC [Acidimicrobiales bacterium]|nr:preprotein translocase subunit YajC [Acidimicrobiales bacterium]